jgi:hypothetical protein
VECSDSRCSSYRFAPNIGLLILGKVLLARIVARFFKGLASITGLTNLKFYEYFLYTSKILKATVLEGGGLINAGKDI